MNATQQLKQIRQGMTALLFLAQNNKVPSAETIRAWARQQGEELDARTLEGVMELFHGQLTDARYLGRKGTREDIATIIQGGVTRFKEGKKPTPQSMATAFPKHTPTPQTKAPQKKEAPKQKIRGLDELQRNPMASSRVVTLLVTGLNHALTGLPPRNNLQKSLIEWLSEGNNKDRMTAILTKRREAILIRNRAVSGALFNPKKPAKKKTVRRPKQSK